MVSMKQLRYTIEAIVQSIRPTKSSFTANSIPDLTGYVCIVTGGYTGIGKETVKALLEHNAKVYIASRNRQKADGAIQELTKTTGKTPLFIELDLGSLASVRQAAKEFLSKETHLNILFNNAGVMWPSADLVTPDGYDLQFGTNVLGHWYLGELLMPALLRGKETSHDKHARIITTSSSGAYFCPFTWGTFEDGPARKKLSTETLYYQSKLGNAVVAAEIARRYGSQGIISISLNPGGIRTELQRHMAPLQRKIMNWLLYPAPMGALTQLFAGTMPEALQYNGQFLIPWAMLGRCRDEVYDPDVGSRLWTWLEDQIPKHSQ